MTGLFPFFLVVELVLVFFFYVQGRAEQGTDGLLSHTGLHLRYLPEVQQLMRH